VAVLTAEHVREALNPSVGEKVVDRSFIDLKVWSVGSPAATSPAGETAAGATRTSVEVGVAARQEQRVTVTLSGDANDFGDTEKEELRGWVAEQLGIEVERVEILSVSSGSVIIEIVIDGDAGVRVRTTNLAAFPEQGGDDDLPMEAVVGLILGIVCVLGGVAVVIYVCRKKKDDSAEELRRNSAEALEGHNTAEGGDVERPSGAFVFGDAGEMGEGSPERNEPYGNDSPKHGAVELPSAIRAQRIQSMSTEGRSRGSGSMSTEPRSRGSVYTEPYGLPVEPTHSDVALNVVEATEGKE